jgi:oxygen-independent coproporphyrinogen-3 oxidase
VFETGWSEGVLAKTLETILLDAQQTVQLLLESGWNRKVTTIYFGGGTPSVVPFRQLEDFLEKFFFLWKSLDPEFAPKEISFEINPENLTTELLDVLERQGVARVSLGIQTFDDEALSLLGRRCDATTNIKALETLSRWKGSWSADLMTGLPGQSPQKLTRDLETLTSFNPKHVSLYALTVEPRTPLAELVRRQKNLLPKAELADNLWIQARDFLTSQGLAWYEIANFARPGWESLHNQTYWRLDPYLGLGPGAASTLPINESWERWTQDGLFAWLTRKDRHPEAEILNERAFLQEHFLTALRTLQGLEIRTLQARFCPRILEWVERTSQTWRAQGNLLETSGKEFLRLTDQARLELDNLLKSLDWP